MDTDRQTDETQRHKQRDGTQRDRDTDTQTVRQTDGTQRERQSDRQTGHRETDRRDAERDKAGDTGAGFGVNRPISM